MFDNFREWLSDNLRYILIGFAGILILVIAFFAIRLVSGLGSPKEKEPETEQVTEAKKDADKDDEAAPSGDGSRLERNKQDVLDVITQYYTARADKDYDTLAQIWEAYDDQTTPAQLESEDAAIESYNNIMTYSKDGMTEGSYVVYVYMDIKLTGIETLAPSLREEYLTTNADGALVVSAQDGSKELEDFLLDLQADDDVQVLIEDVNKKMKEAEEQDEDLKNFVETGTVANPTEGTDGSGTEGEQSGGTTVAVGAAMATTEVNVRGTPSTDGTLYGILQSGMSVEVLENTADGWSKIRYTTNGTTIEGYVKSEYLSAAQ